jgi:hypothetical protein
VVFPACGNLQYGIVKPFLSKTFNASSSLSKLKLKLV